MRRIVDGIYSARKTRTCDSPVCCTRATPTQVIANTPVRCVALPSYLPPQRRLQPRSFYLADARIFPKPSAPAW